MSFRTSLAAFATLLLLALTGAPACQPHETVRADLVANDASSDGPIDLDDVDHRKLTATIFEMTNAVRDKHDRPPVTHHRLLEKAADRYAHRMADAGFISHEDAENAELRTPEDRLAAVGADNPYPAENIAYVPAFPIGHEEKVYVLDPDGPVVSRSPDGEPIEPHTYASFAAAVVEGWMNSPGHRKNLLNPEAVQLGIGAARRPQGGLPAFIVVQKFQLYEELE